MKLPKLALILTLVAAVIGLIYIYMVKTSSTSPAPKLSTIIPPIQKYCQYEDGLQYSKYKQTEELWEANNKFGIYVYAENADFFEIAQNLVNSKGGQWGYVLIPYNIGDYDEDKWGRVFEQLDSKKLIPIIQLSDFKINDYKRDVKRAAEFLDKFVWPIKYRYISFFNEPNDAKFWLGKVDAAQYAEVLDYSIDTFKAQSPNYFALNAGLNTSSADDRTNMDAFDFIKEMEIAKPGIFEKLDGWASHSYPQPNFSGSPDTSGRWGIRAYDTELAFLKSVIGVRKALPVFITETGWAHAEGKNYNNSFFPANTVGEYFEKAYKDYWLPDERVRAVIAFTIWYPEPFDHFSWVNEDKVPYQHYNVVKSMKKTKGKPPSLDVNSLMINVCNV